MKTHFLRTAAIALLTLTPLFPSTARIAIAAPEVQSAPMVSAVQQAQGIRVPLRPSPAGDTFYVSVEINGAVTVDMMLDSGAADIAVSEEVFQRLGADAIKVGEREYRIANGSVVRRALITIKTLRVGELVLNDVRASVGTGPLLLGQTFLKRLSSWSVDNAANVLILEAAHSEETPAPPVEAPKNTARDDPPTFNPPLRYGLTDFEHSPSIFGPPTYKPSLSRKDTGRFPLARGYMVQIASQGDRRVGPFETAADADQFCSDIKGAGGQCIVQKW